METIVTCSTVLHPERNSWHCALECNILHLDVIKYKDGVLVDAQISSLKNMRITKLEACPRPHCTYFNNAAIFHILNID